MLPQIRMIVAMTPNRGIGYRGKLPWEHAGLRLIDDMTHFRNLTIGEYPTQNAVVMGRKTWESLPPAHMPLHNRVNCVLTSNLPLFNMSIHKLYTLKNDIYGFTSIENCIDYLWILGVKNIWLIGGERIYRQMIDKYYLSDIWITKVDLDLPVDTYFPELPSYFVKTHEYTKENSKIACYSGDYKKYMNPDELGVSLTFQHWEHVIKYNNDN